MNTEYLRTDRLYETDSYCIEFEASVVACYPAETIYEEWRDVEEDEKKQSPAWAVALDRTAFFPEGGGQGADTGWFIKEGERYAVYDVQIIQDVVYHLTNLKAQPGDQIQGKIDWDQRFSNMQQHSGEHIFSGLVYRHFGYHNVGFHLGSAAVTMDFDGGLTEEYVERLEWEANEAIVKNVPVTVSYPSQEELSVLNYRSKKEIEGQVRIVTIEGYDVCACCAPHVTRTGEIGLLKVIGQEKYKGGIRISILCGFRALQDYRRKQKEGHAISTLLSAPQDHIAEAVEQKLEENTAQRQKIYELNRRLIEEKIESIPQGKKSIWFYEGEMEAGVMRKTVNLALERVEKYAGIFCGDDEQGYRYIIGAKRGDAREVAAFLKERLHARGGGSKEMVQGQVKASRQEIEDVLSRTFFEP